MPSHAKLLAALACALSLQGAFAQSPGDERANAYRQYREAFDARNYEQALPLAVRVVELTSNQFGNDEPELANPLTNLATTLYRLKRYGEAVDNYRRALTLLDQAGNPTDPRLVAPLHGLGATLRALERYEESIVPLKRAVDIVRNRDGLHAPAQLPILDALIDSFEKTWRLEDAGREHQYAFNVAEQSFGREDPRMVAPLNRLAGWNEKIGRYTAARLLYMRGVQIADRESPGSMKAVDSLRGIARAYRLAFVYGETQDAAIAGTENLPQSMAGAPLGMMVATPSGEGERALRNALDRLAQAGDAKAAERGAILVDLGDWYRIAGAGGRAMEAWTRAWAELGTAGDTSALEQPATIIYRPPAAAASQRQQDPNKYAIQEVQVRVSVAADGDVRAVNVANPVDGRESVERAVTGALRRAIWRPAFAGGVPVAVTDHVFRESVYVKLSENSNGG